MATYIYSRDLVNGLFNIDNRLRVDAEGKQIHLASEIASALPGKLQRLCCNGPEAHVHTLTDLSPAEKSTLDAVVQAHKSNT